MPPDSVQAVTLICHPETFTDAVRGIGVRVRRSPAELAVTYVLEGDFDRLRVPPQSAPGVGSRLWQHTCCEIFVACKGSPAYYEFNFSPSGEWAAYAFDGYRSPRTGESHAAGLAPRLGLHLDPGRLELDAVIRLDHLTAPYLAAPLSVALSAVVEDSDGALSYWALRHPPGKPDFHHPQAFALELRE